MKRVLWVESWGYVNTPDECRIYIRHEDPTLGPVAKEEIFDSPRGCMMPLGNHQIFRVEFDAEKMVKKIKNITEEKEELSVIFSFNPRIRSIDVGRKLPKLD
jgi:hypothetical protein